MHRFAVSMLLVGVLGIAEPGRAEDSAGSIPVTERDDVIYGRKADLALTMDVFTPGKQNGAAIVHLANGGWHKAHGEPQNFAELLKRGYTVFRVVIAGEPKFTILEQAPDVARAVRFIRFHAKDYKIDPDRIGIEGASSGGHMSLLHAMGGDDGNPAAPDPVDRAGLPRAGRGRLFPADRFFELRSTGRRARGRPWTAEASPGVVRFY